MSGPRPPPPRWDQYDRLHVDDDDTTDRRLLNGAGTGASSFRKRGRNKKTGKHKWTTWSFVACIFIGITILLAVIVGILASVFYETKNASREREAFLMERAGGHAEAYLFRRDQASDAAGSETSPDIHEEAGLIRIYAEDEGFRVVAEISHLKPGSVHAMHIFEFTDPTYEELGNIYSPEPVPHGCPGVSVEHRVGDLGNIVVNKFGVAMYDQKVRGASIMDIIGRTIAIHESKDDCISQPLGDSGHVIASGVIGLGNPKQSDAAPPSDKSSNQIGADVGTNGVAESESGSGSAPAPADGGGAADDGAAVASANAVGVGPVSRLRSISCGSAGQKP